MPQGGQQFQQQGASLCLKGVSSQFSRVVSQSKEGSLFNLLREVNLMFKEVNLSNRVVNRIPESLAV